MPTHKAFRLTPQVSLNQETVYAYAAKNCNKIIVCVNQYCMLNGGILDNQAEKRIDFRK